jgi:hypothetical protein
MYFSIDVAQAELQFDFAIRFHHSQPGSEPAFAGRHLYTRPRVLRRRRVDAMLLGTHGFLATWPWAEPIRHGPPRIRMEAVDGCGMTGTLWFLNDSWKDGMSQGGP